MPAEDNDQTIMSFMTLCLTILLGPACRSGRVAPEHPPWLRICKYEQLLLQAKARLWLGVAFAARPIDVDLLDRGCEVARRKPAVKQATS